MQKTLDQLEDCIRKAPRLGAARKEEMLSLIAEMRQTEPGKEFTGKLETLGAELQSTHPDLAEIISRLTIMLNSMGI